MGFTRKFLMDNGVPEDKVDAIMAERNRTLADYIPKADVQAQIDEALQNAKPQPADVTQTAEYKALLGERDMLRAIGSEDFSSVKPKFREQVFNMLDRGEAAPAIPEQLTAVAEKYEEYFLPVSKEPPAKPQFGAPLQGSMPKGETGAVKGFSDAWGFCPQKKE